MPRRPFHQLEHLLLTFAAACVRAAATSARFRPAPGARRAPRHSMSRLSMRWVDRLPINRPLGIGKPGHVVCAIAHPRVIREAEKSRCPADGASVNAFVRSLRLGITDLVSHSDLSLDDTRHGCVRWLRRRWCTLDKSAGRAISAGWHFPAHNRSSRRGERSRSTTRNGSLSSNTARPVPLHFAQRQHA